MKKGFKLGSVAGKAAVITVIAAVILTLGIVVAYAFLAGRSQNTIKNDLKADVDPTASINETTTDNTKKDVSVTVAADYSTYVRAAVVINWIEVDASGKPTGNVHSKAPVKGTDFSISYKLVYGSANLAPEKWTEGGDGFFYYSSPVAPNGTTTVLVSECKTLAGANVPESETEGNSYKLNVTIAAQTIQAKGTTDEVTYEAGTPAVVQAWGVNTKEDSSAVPTGFLIYKGEGKELGVDDATGFELPNDEHDHP